MTPPQHVNEVYCASPYLSPLLSSCPIVFSHSLETSFKSDATAEYETCMSHLLSFSGHRPLMGIS